MMQEKTFFLENQETNKSQLIKWQIPSMGLHVDLQKLITRIPEAHKKIFKIYNPQKDQYVELGNKQFQSSFTVARELLKLNVLMIKYSDNPQYMDSDDYSESEESNKKQRSRERNIRQVIELVQKWRQFHDNPPDGKKKTLQQAAKYVGVSKKSLDDYYYQLRIGEKHDFDFASHFEDKIGALRAFIKTKQPERKVQGKNAKHPKKLKIIEQFTEKLKITDNSGSGQSQVIIPKPKIQQDVKSVSIAKNNILNQQMQSIFESNNDQFFWGAPYTPISQQKFNDCEKNFYNDFDFGLEDLGDPYLPFIPLDNLMSKKSDGDFRLDDISR